MGGLGQRDGLAAPQLGVGFAGGDELVLQLERRIEDRLDQRNLHPGDVAQFLDHRGHQRIGGVDGLRDGRCRSVSLRHGFFRRSLGAGCCIDGGVALLPRPGADARQQKGRDDEHRSQIAREARVGRRAFGLGVGAIGFRLRAGELVPSRLLAFRRFGGFAGAAGGEIGAIGRIELGGYIGARVKRAGVGESLAAMGEPGRVAPVGVPFARRALDRFQRRQQAEVLLQPAVE